MPNQTEAINEGKYIKQQDSIIIKDNKSSNDISDSIDNNDWIHSNTLGGKAKAFWWKVDREGSLIIKRKFKSDSITQKKISKMELEQINNYMKQKDWVDLANSVDKLSNGTEKEGLGKFLYNDLGWKVIDAQLASHIGVIFTFIDCWEYNRRKRGIQFKLKRFDWEHLLEDYI
ncbi:hypothetical protein [Alkalihalobacillus sp. BA299]|uniref:hypothetical protein n=1 Tax=Alkalihalobacillus sp. BA299 TaxID=2815938 RepID=UPI001ADA6760|nr:hypothetical protein [Alkalihalobacillus sp. BA299]